MHGNAGIDIFGNGWNGSAAALPCCDQAVLRLARRPRTTRLARHHVGRPRREFGRTPRISRGGSASGAIIGPIATPRCLPAPECAGAPSTAASDSQAAIRARQSRFARDFAATLFHALRHSAETGISPDGFSVRASTGRPILGCSDGAGAEQKRKPRLRGPRQARRRFLRTDVVCSKSVARQSPKATITEPQAVRVSMPGADLAEFTLQLLPRRAAVRWNGRLGR